MTPQRAKELLPIIQAFAEGKTIQVASPDDNDWNDCPHPSWLPYSRYRIKPEPVYGWICISKSATSSTGYVNSCIFASEHAAKAHAERNQNFHKIVKIRLDNTNENED